MHVYHSRLSFASFTLLLFWLIVNSSAATRYNTDDRQRQVNYACMDGPADIYLGVMYLASLAA